MGQAGELDISSVFVALLVVGGSVFRKHISFIISIYLQKVHVGRGQKVENMLTCGIIYRVLVQIHCSVGL